MGLPQFDILSQTPSRFDRSIQYPTNQFQLIPRKWKAEWKLWYVYRVEINTIAMYEHDMTHKRHIKLNGDFQCMKLFKYLYNSFSKEDNCFEMEWILYAS